MAPGFVVGEPLGVRIAREGIEVLATRGKAVGDVLKAVGDVLEEDQPQREVLVLGRLHAAAQGVGGVEQELLGRDVLVVAHCRGRT